MTTSILLFEDDEAMARLIRRRLEAAGHLVRAFTHAESVLDEIDRGASFDLYLLDVMTATRELSGPPLARAIASRFPGAHIIFMTGDPYLVSEADRSLGTVLAKPLDFALLLREIGREPAACRD